MSISDAKIFHSLSHLKNLVLLLLWCWTLGTKWRLTSPLFCSFYWIKIWCAGEHQISLLFHAIAAKRFCDIFSVVKPIYGVYTNTVDIACSYIIDSLNLFWLSLGWTTCMFVPSIIFASKLYKWFRRMDQEEYFEEFIAYDSHHNK